MGLIIVAGRLLRGFTARNDKPLWCHREGGCKVGIVQQLDAIRLDRIERQTSLAQEAKFSTAFDLHSYT
jgi:hypothetical protein